MAELQLNLNLPVIANNSGLFISSGQGRHPDRIIDSFELIFVKTGRLCIQEEENNFIINSNEYVILWPNRRHWGSADYTGDLTFYWIHFHLNDSQQGFDKLNIPQQGCVIRPDRLTELFRRFLDDQESGWGNPLNNNILITMMLNEAIQSDIQKEQSSSATVLANRAEVYIRIHFDGPISTSAVADYLHCNPDYLGRVFQRVYHTTITDYIHRCRFKRALQLLLDENASIEEVARTCGYTDIRYFRNQFKLREGMTPLAYRKLYAQTHINTH
jgi:AraC-like DNA-binding protein